MELILIYGFFAAGLIFSLFKDTAKTWKALKVSRNVFFKFMPSLLIITGLIGLLLGFIPPQTIENYLGEEAGIYGTLLAAIFGSVTLIPNIIAMPLAGSLLRSGASVVTTAVLITTLTMVGTVTFPLEIKTFSVKFALLRNGLSLAAALVIAFAMGAIL